MLILQALSLLLLGVMLFGLLAGIMQSLLTWRYLRRGPKLESSLPGISILKPLCGVDDDLEANLRHFADLDYPRYEVLLGVKDERDPAYPVAVAATRRWPKRFRLYIQRGEPGLNPKVNQLVTLEPQARYDILLVNDSNCRTPPGYLSEIAAAFEDPKVGCTTNAICGMGERRLGSLLDNFYMGSVVSPGMIAAKVSPAKHDIVVGKSMALRRSALEALGGFYAARNHLAEDYVLGRGTTQLGLKVFHCRLPVFQVSQDKSLSDYVKRQKRWCVIHRTAIKTITYFGNGILDFLLWGFLAMVLWPSRLTLLAFCAAWACKTALDSFNTRLFRGRLFGWFTPFATLLKDLAWGLAWMHGLFHRTVNWRGNPLRVHHGSLLVPAEAEADAGVARFVLRRRRAA